MIFDYTLPINYKMGSVFKKGAVYVYFSKHNYTFITRRTT